jgi:NitT/TauT family transport system substrate-binding protein
MDRRTVTKGMAVTGLAVAAPYVARAQSPTKITIAYTATIDFGSGFVASEQGLFKKRGLDVEWKLVPLNSQIPAALASDSMQIGGTTTSVMIQAADGGLDLAAIAGSGTTNKDQALFGVVMKSDVAYAKPEDYAGKKIGAPGLGAFLHVLFRNWLIDNGVDWKKVTFVEVGFPQMADVLKGGTVDGVVTGDPVMSRIVTAGIGRKTTNFGENLKGDIPVIVYSATRKWATANPDAAVKFREAISEATAIANSDDKAVRTAAAKYLKFPPELLNTMALGKWKAEVTDAGIQSWIDIMKRQDMLRSELDVKKLVVR